MKKINKGIMTSQHKQLHEARENLAILCSKCDYPVFRIKAVKETTKGIYCDLICESCSEKLNLKKWRGQEIKLIRVGKLRGIDITNTKRKNGNKRFIPIM